MAQHRALRGSLRARLSRPQGRPGQLLPPALEALEQRLPPGDLLGAAALTSSEDVLAPPPAPMLLSSSRFATGHPQDDLSLLDTRAVIASDQPPPAPTGTPPIAVWPVQGDLFPAPPDSRTLPLRFLPSPAGQTPPQGSSGGNAALPPGPPVQPTAGSPSTAHLAATNPADPTYTAGTQWGLNGAYGIRAPQAWDVGRGSMGVTVAVLDTGMDVNHPDLYQNVWLNQAEIPLSRLQNLKDVDGDHLITFRDLNNPLNQGPGKITDVNRDGRIDAADVLAPMQFDAQGHDTGLGGWAYPGNTQDGDTAHPNDFVGWNFIDNTNTPTDDVGHGTHVAGTIGAMADNNTGVAGIDWQVQLMPLKLFSLNDVADTASFTAALQYALRHGARVSNNSYTGVDDPSFQQALDSAATWNFGPGQGQGMVFVAAAGNDGLNADVSPEYPAAFPEANVLSVAATDVNGKLAAFSDYGATTVDVGAPGVDVFSTYPGKSFGWSSGTSMASPHAAGVAALVLAQNPTWSASQVAQRLVATATPDPALAGKTVSGGIVNAAAALGLSGAAASPGVVSVDLGRSFNRTGITKDGVAFKGGLDSNGNAYSNSAMRSFVAYNGLSFGLGTPTGSNLPDVVSAAGQTLTLPAGNYSSLSFVGTAVNGSQASQTFMVNYGDGTSRTFTQSLSDWTAPQNFPGETVAATMHSFDLSTGKPSTAFPVSVYGYTFALDPGKQVQSITLPVNGNVEVLAMNLVPAPSVTPPPPPPSGQPVDLSRGFNRISMAADGTTFSTTAGIDTSGHALSATQLGSSMTWNRLGFNLAPGNVNDTVAAAGQTLALPPGSWSTLSFLATSAWNNYTNQTFKVTYGDGSTQTFTQSFSVWTAAQHYPGEAVVSSMTYHNNANGTATTQATFVYGYSFSLDPARQVKSITLPNQAKINVLAMTLS